MKWGNMSLEERLYWRIVLDRPRLLVCKDEYEKVDIIRDWTYENVIFAGTSETYSKESAEYYILKVLAGEQIDYGYYCGGVASVLSNIYTYLGYNACSLDMAIFDKEGNVLASHVSTLVNVKGKWLIEDATFNITYVDEEGKKLDIYSLREKMARGESVDVEHGKTIWKKCISSSPVYAGVYERNDICDEIGGRYFFQLNLDADVFIETISDYIIADGYNAESAVMYMYYAYDIYIPSGATGNRVFNMDMYTDLKNHILTEKTDEIY